MAPRAKMIRGKRIHVMKKFLSLLLAAMMVASLLTG